VSYNNSEVEEIVIPGGVMPALVAAILLSIWIPIGVFVSPRGSDGRPVLLSPDVRAVESYRRAATGWVGEWSKLDSDLQSILETTQGTDLLNTSRRAQQAFDQALALSRAVEETDSPSSLLGLQAQAKSAGSAYVDAAIAIARWVSAPSAEHRAEARRTLENATRVLRDIQNNEWMRQQKGSH
jgi:hypothetical protein